MSDRLFQARGLPGGVVFDPPVPMPGLPPPPPPPPRAIATAPTAPPSRTGVCHGCRAVTLTRLCPQCRNWYCKDCAALHQEPEMPSVTLTVPPGHEDEAAILRLVRDRLVMGAREYGRLDLELDQRNLLTEALEETVDGTIYTAGQLLKLRRMLAALEAEGA